MSENRRPQEGLVDLARKEAATRSGIFRDLGEALVNPEIPFTLKLLILLVLADGIGISAIITICIIAAITTSAQGDKFDPSNCFLYTFLLVVALMGIGILFVLNAGSTEQALRLDASLNKIYDARYAG